MWQGNIAIVIQLFLINQWEKKTLSVIQLFNVKPDFF